MDVRAIANELEKTNVPAEPEVQALVNAERLRLQNEISELEREIVGIQAKRAALEKERQVFSAVMSPIRTLPAEILLEIFGHIRPLDRANVLAGVCQKWRRAVLEISSTWLDLTLPGRGYRDAPTLETLRAHVRHYIDHARGKAITLTINELPELVLELLLDFIFSNPISHWSGVIITPSYPRHLSQVLTYFENNPLEIQYLTTFGIHAVESDFNDGMPLLNLKNLAALRTLVLHGMNHTLVVSISSVSWRALTSLTIKNKGPPEQLLSILKQCRHLRHLDIHLEDMEDDDSEFGGEGESETDKEVDDDEEDNESNEEAEMEDEAQNTTTNGVFSLKHLRKLCIMSDDTPSIILRQIRAPSVQELVFGFPSNRWNTSIQKFLDRLQKKLLIFHCSGEALIPALKSSKSFSSLKTLRVIEPFPYYGQMEEPDQEPDPHVFGDLIYTPGLAGQEGNIPRLECLEIVMDEALEDFKVHVLLAQVLASRCNLDGPNPTTHRLRRVVLQAQLVSYVEWEKLEIFGRLRRQGVLVDHL